MKVLHQGFRMIRTHGEEMGIMAKGMEENSARGAGS